MIAFTVCPKCRDPMLHEIHKTGPTTQRWKFFCQNKLDHQLVGLTVDTDPDDRLHWLTVRISPNYAVWDFQWRTLKIVKALTINLAPFMSGQLVPFFEPNFSDYDKVINKLKTYITFT